MNCDRLIVPDNAQVPRISSASISDRSRETAALNETGRGGQVRPDAEPDERTTGSAVAVAGGRGACATCTAVAGWCTGAGLIAGAGIVLLFVSYFSLLRFGCGDPSLTLMLSSALERIS